MPVPTRHIYYVVPKKPVTGDEIEAFLEEADLRSDGVTIYGNSAENAFQPNQSYTTIAVGSDTPNEGIPVANKLINRFGGYRV